MRRLDAGTRLHVFSFGGQAICPTIEEFEALMESRRDEKIIHQPRFGHIQALGWMCELTLHEAQSLVHNGEWDIPDLIHRFSDVDDRGDLLWQGFRQHALCLCVLTHFLLTPSFGRSSIRLIEVAQGLKGGKSCISLVLAETLMGLNAFHRRETTKFARSPLILQVMFPTLFNMCFSHLSALLLYFSLKALFSLFSQRISLYSLISLFFHLFPGVANGQIEDIGLLPCILNSSILLPPTTSGFPE